MQNTSNSVTLSAALKEWFDALKPLYGSLSSIIKQEKISPDSGKNIISLMKEASIACQKVSDTEFELQNISAKMDGVISNLEKQKSEYSNELSGLENNKNLHEEDLNKLKDAINNLSSQLDNIKGNIEKLAGEQEILSSENERKKDEEFELDNLIKEKKSALREIELKVSQKETEYKKLLNGFDDDLAREEIIEEKDRYKYSKAKVEIMEMLVSILSKEVPQLSNVWNLLEDIIYTYDIDLIHEKIRDIKGIVASLNLDSIPKTEPVELKEPALEAEADEVEKKKAETKKMLESEIENLGKQAALLTIEAQNRKNRSDELSSRIEEKTFAVQKLEQYLQDLKSNISSFESDYNKISEKFSTLNKAEGLTESLSHLSHIDREYYFDEFYNKIQQFYQENHERVLSGLNDSYEKLRNAEKLISLKQKELNIIEEKINKEYPNYELKIANLQLRLQRKDKDLEILNGSISENTEKLKRMDEEIAGVKSERKALEDECAGLSKKIIELETDIRGKADNIQNLNYTVKEDELKIKQLEDQNKLLNEEMLNQTSKSKGYEALLSDYKSRLSDSETSVKDMTMKLKEMQEMIDIGTEKLTYLQELSLQKDETLSELKTGLKKAEEGNFELIEDNGNFRTEIKRIQALLDEKISEEEKLREELTLLSKRKNDGEKAILELEKVNTSLASQIRRRENLLEELETENRTLKEKIKETSEHVN